MQDAINDLLSGSVIIRLDTAHVALGLLQENSVDSVVTDPPGGKGMFGRSWDRSRGGRKTWIAWLTSIMEPVFRATKPGGYILSWAFPAHSHWTATAIEDAGFDVCDIVHHLFGRAMPKGQMLKPLCEHWILGRKPARTTLKANIEQFGTGKLNVDACRIGNDPIIINRWDAGAHPFGGAGGQNLDYTSHESTGRYPANVIWDGSLAVQEALPSGTASFFYCAKASRADIEEGIETPLPEEKCPVKSTDMMRMLCRLITPPGGVILDPFMGWGSTGKAAVLEKFSFIGIEEDAVAFDMARQRIAHTIRNPVIEPEPDRQIPLFPEPDLPITLAEDVGVWQSIPTHNAAGDTLEQGTGESQKQATTTAQV